MLRSILRSTLSAWGRTNVVPGYHYIAVERYGPALAGGTPLGSTLPNGCRILCDLHDHIQRHQWFFGAYEPIESYLFTRMLKPGMNVVDAGANVGQYAMLASTGVGPAGSVHAFEPVPRNYERMRQAVESNALTNLRLHRAALWHEPATLRLTLAADQSDNAGGYSVFHEETPASVEAPALRLDDYVAEVGLDRVHVIKMDVEGAEARVLEGAAATIRRDRPILLMEISRDWLAAAGDGPSPLADLLRAHGYRAWKIGLSVETSGPVGDVADLERANVILHHDDLPPDVTGGWDLRTALRWARRAW